MNSTPESPSSCQSLLSPLWRLCQVKVCGQPLSTPPTLLGNGPFQKPKVTDTVYVPSLGPFPSGLVQVQWQCWPASSPCEGTGTAELRLVLTALGMQGIQQLQPTRRVFILAARSGGSRFITLPCRKGVRVLSIKEWGALGAPSTLNFPHQQSVGLGLVRPGFES